MSARRQASALRARTRQLEVRSYIEQKQDLADRQKLVQPQQQNVVVRRLTAALDVVLLDPVRQRPDRPAPGLRGRARHRVARLDPRHQGRPQLVDPRRRGDGRRARLYGALEEHILARDQVSASQAFYSLMRAAEKLGLITAARIAAGEEGVRLTVEAGMERIRDLAYEGRGG